MESQNICRKCINYKYKEKKYIYIDFTTVDRKYELCFVIILLPLLLIIITIMILFIL